MNEQLVGWIAAIGSVAAAVGGLWLGLRSLRTRELRAYRADLDVLSGDLAEERRKRLEAEVVLYRLRLTLAQRGIIDEPPDTNRAGDGPDRDVGAAGDPRRDQTRPIRGADPGHPGHHDR